MMEAHTAHRGLTEEEAAVLRSSGEGNTPPPALSKSTSQILQEHICTRFNLFNLLIAIALAAAGAWSNLLFIFVITLNSAIGIIQEFRAKQLVEQIALLTSPKARVLRGGFLREIPVEDLVLGDLVSLERGMQVPADATVLEGEAEADESLITGESDPVSKTAGTELFSGSVLTAGACLARVKRVGADGFAARLTQEAKRSCPIQSELVESMERVTRFTGWLIPPLGILLFLQAVLLRGEPMYAAVTATAAGLLGMLPKGLVLLISVSLAVGISRLAKSRVLVQNLFALETLAHVDVLCLDKTGTLTQGEMHLTRTVFLTESLPAPFGRLMASFLEQVGDNNATFQALRAAFSDQGTITAAGKIPFSSDRKWSAVTFQGLGTLVLGAPERMTGVTLTEELQAEVRRGSRVLLAAWTEEAVTPKNVLPIMRPLAALILSDPIREGTADTLDYFRREGVNLKIISGDHPAAASALAAKAGVPNAGAWVDMSQVTTPQELARAAAKYTVFGRTTPDQKRDLVKAFQAQGHSVAMTGDGVNDILAMRAADCSIAMAKGSEATRQAAQVVLLDSNFSALPQLLAEGRRVVNNMRRVAGVFFVKTLYSMLLSAFCVLTNLPFPLIPIQVTLIDLAIEGYPAFFQSLVPDGKKVEGRFLPYVLRRALPNALAILAVDAFLLLGGGALLSIQTAQIPLVLYLILGAVEVEALLKSCLPLTPLRAFLLLTAGGGFFAAVFLFHGLLALPPLDPVFLPTLLALCAGAILAERLCALALRRFRLWDPPTGRQTSSALHCS